MNNLKTLLAGLLLATLLPAAASAATLLWTIDNDYNRTVSLEFYSQDRGHVWPGNGQVYVIDPNEGNAQFNLSCNYNELICYGAWVRGSSRTYWGVGPNDSYNCSNCCARCGLGDVEGIQLLP
ncbi:hypothetical protein P1J78_09015 [Psychromarinibacter sp. C21-152]|uniref:Uncharacterized protein n=1 Tax=Psychromarinibacter sediminicola TaxID=3033385 RepID=A0AAE3NTX6_9RHOB|nr:hypothetical protein [Psychromarinibacter sediminicola]MDF0600870.1 hypothetical protein [Psychromarinibacter sediminicola]